MIKMVQSICDKAAFGILTELFDNPQGLRFKDIRKKVVATDPMIASRLNFLKSCRLIEVYPVMDQNDDERYFAYRITAKGKQFAEQVEVKRLIRAVEQLENIKIMTP